MKQIKMIYIELYGNHKNANMQCSPLPKPQNLLSSSFFTFAFTKAVISYIMLAVTASEKFLRAFLRGRLREL